MNRLTEIQVSKDGRNQIYYVNPRWDEKYTPLQLIETFGETSLINLLYTILNKLANYEDTGLEPEEVKQLNGGWISVKERLPERIFEDCLITTEKGEIYTSEFYGYGEVFQGHKEYPEGVWQIDQYGETVIAWQPLPFAYKEIENE